VNRIVLLGLAFSRSFAGLAMASDAIEVTSHPVANTKHAVKNLQLQLGKINSFSASFVQLTQDGIGNTLQKVEGYMQVEKPGKLRWETKGIYEQLVISDGDSLWIYDADLEQVSIKNMDNRLAETPALLLGGDVSAIDDDFIITQAPSDNQILFILQPKDGTQLFDSLELSFNKLHQQQPLAQMIIRDASGQVTVISFDEVINNPKFEKELFTFDIPEGIDVIDGRKGSY
jgi:outer membrane lipoprotein carrier protein